MEKVELLPAFMWICPNCGKTNFERAMSVVLTGDELDLVRDQFGLGDEAGGNFLTMPEFVVCSECGDKLESSDPEDFLI